MTYNEPKPRRAGLVTALTLLSLVFAILAFTTTHNVIFGILAIGTGTSSLVLNRLVWRK